MAELAIRSVRASLREVWANLRGILDELSDQNAYRRHLAAHRATDSPEQWRKFQDARLEGKSRQGRCC